MIGGDSSAGTEAITLYTRDRSDIVITGTNVVPEFPIHVAFMISATIGAIIAKAEWACYHDAMVLILEDRSKQQQHHCCGAGAKDNALKFSGSRIPASVAGWVHQEAVNAGGLTSKKDRIHV